MTSERDRCLVAIAVLNPDSKDRVSVIKASEQVVFRDYKAEFGKGMKVFHYFRVRNYRVPVRFNGINFQTTLKQQDYELLFQQHERQ